MTEKEIKEDIEKINIILVKLGEVTLVCIKEIEKINEKLGIEKE